jgi:hypothetical protein
MSRNARWPLLALAAIILVLLAGLFSVSTADLFRWGSHPLWSYPLGLTILELAVPEQPFSEPTER